MKRLEQMEQTCRRIGKTLGDVCDAFTPRIGFCLVLFEYGDEPDRWLTYLSNGDRGSMIAMLRELTERVMTPPKVKA